MADGKPVYTAAHDANNPRKARQTRIARRSAHLARKDGSLAAPKGDSAGADGDQALKFSVVNKSPDASAGAPMEPSADQAADMSAPHPPVQQAGRNGGGAAGGKPGKKQGKAGGALATVQPRLPARQQKRGEVGEPLPEEALEIAAAAREARMREIRRELRRRRRRRFMWIFLRFALFVLIPTGFVAWYYYEEATDMYVSESAMVFKSGANATAGGGLLGGLMGGGGAITDSIALQEYITSRDILQRLIDEHGWLDHFQSEEIDWWHRLDAEATLDDAFSYYKGNFLKLQGGKVEVSYDQLEGIVRLKLTAATPEAAKRFSQAIISYGEELVNQLNDRSRNDGVRMSEAKVEEARDALRDAQRRVAEVQEQLNIFSVESEAGALQGRISLLEGEIDEIIGQIEKLNNITSNRNDSRFAPLRSDLEVKTRQLRELRGKLTGGDNRDDLSAPSMAQLSAALELARVDQATSQQMYASALSSQEQAIAMAAEQSLFLETVVRPSEPQSSARPNRLRNTGLVFLVLFAGYIIGLLTFSLIREQAAI